MEWSRMNPPEFMHWWWWGGKQLAEEGRWDVRYMALKSDVTQSRDAKGILYSGPRAAHFDPSGLHQWNSPFCQCKV